MKLENVLTKTTEAPGEKPKDILAAVLSEGSTDMPAIADPSFFNRDTDLRKLDSRVARDKPAPRTNLDLENPAPVEQREPGTDLVPFTGGDALAEALGPNIDTLGRLGIEAGTSEAEIRTLLRKVLRKL